MDKDPPTPQNLRPEVYSQDRQTTGKTKKEESNRESKNCALSKQDFYSTKERLARWQVDSRPVNSQFLHKLSPLQDVNNKGSEVVTPERFLDNIYRLQRWLLACASKPHKEIFSRLPLEKSKLAIQSNAFRPEYSPAHFYQGGITRGKIDVRSRNMVSTIFGRPSHSGSHTRRMSTQNQTSSGNSKITRMDTKHREVTAVTCSGIRVARSSFRPHHSYSHGTPRKDVHFSRISETTDKCTILLSSRNYAVAGCGKLVVPTRPNCEADYAKNKENNKIPEEVGTRHSSNSGQKYETQYLQMDPGNSHSTESGNTTTQHHHSDRCLSEGLGIPDKQQSVLRQVRQDNVILDKCPRITDNIILPINSRREGSCNSDIVRQLISHSSSQTECIIDTPSLSLGRNNMEESSSVPMDYIHLSHTGMLQCDGGSAIQRDGTIDGMVPLTKGFPNNSQLESFTPSGLVCHKPKQQAPNLHLSLSGLEGSFSGCSINPVGCVETPLSVSPNKSDFKGIGQDDSFTIRECSVNYTRHSNQTLVHGIGTQEGPISPDRSPTPTGSSGPPCNEITNHQTSRLEALKASYNKKFPDCEVAISLMARPLRETSIKDYQQKWYSFITYLERKNISPRTVSITSVIQFLTYLFIDKGLKPSTVSHYKTALTKPLLKVFDIDIKIPDIGDLIRGMQVKRPNQPAEEPQWNLNKVLKYIDEDLPDQLSDEELLRKTAFLLLLATGMRISELRACVRSNDFCQFTQSYLRIRSHPNFIAKNEPLDKRWTFRVVKSLKLPNGNASKLCPVSTLRSYLNRTSGVKDGPLFISVGRDAKALTVNQLSMEVCRIILKADPQTKAKVHDVRKYAASCAFAHTMLTPTELSESIGWSGPATFFKYYRTAIEPLTREVSLPGPDPQDRHL